MNRNHVLASTVMGVVVAVAALGLTADDGKDGQSHHFEFKPDTLVLSRSVYEGTASTVTIGEM